MPETSEEWFARARTSIERDGYRPWASSEWTTWPFDGAGGVRELEEPAAVEPARHGSGAVGCRQCDALRSPDPSGTICWRDDLMVLGVPVGGTSMPFLGFLVPRRHADLSDLTGPEAARMGELQVALERAVTDVLDVPRLQLCRWGDGSEHLHWWAYGRPSRVLQLRGTFLSHWEDLLPLREERDVRADLDLVAARLVELVGGEALPAGPV